MNEHELEKYAEMVDDHFFNIKQKELEEIEPDIPADPPPELIKQLLGELPAQIEHLKRQSILIRTKIFDLKLLIEGKKQSLELEKSRIRKECLDNYQKDLRSFVLQFNQKFLANEKKDNPENSKIKIAKSSIQDVIKLMKPEKPTSKDLEDIANLRTDKLQKEILEWRSKLNTLEEYYELFRLKAERYENKFISVRAYKGLLVEEMKIQF